MRRRSLSTNQQGEFHLSFDATDFMRRRLAGVSHRT
jgi:hypothetical protein